MSSVKASPSSEEEVKVKVVSFSPSVREGRVWFGSSRMKSLSKYGKRVVRAECETGDRWSRVANWEVGAGKYAGKRVRSK